jgi:hypothetical protein
LGDAFSEMIASSPADNVNLVELNDTLTDLPFESLSTVTTTSLPADFNMQIAPALRVMLVLPTLTPNCL